MFRLTRHLLQPVKHLHLEHLNQGSKLTLNASSALRLNLKIVPEWRDDVIVTAEKEGSVELELSECGTVVTATNTSPEEQTITATVPEKLHLIADAQNGSITVSSKLEGNCTLTARNDITVNKLRGHDIDLFSKRGKITVSKLVEAGGYVRGL